MEPEYSFWFEDSGFCLHLQYGPSLDSSCIYAIVALYHGDTVSLDLQIQPLHVLRQFVDEVGIAVG